MITTTPCSYYVLLFVYLAINSAMDDNIPQPFISLPTHLGRNKRSWCPKLARGDPSSRRSNELFCSVDKLKSRHGHVSTLSPTKRVRCYSHLRESQRGRCYRTNGQILQCQESTSDRSSLRAAVTAEGGQSLSGSLVSVGN